jgi:hypothetical protein
MFISSEYIRKDTNERKQATNDPHGCDHDTDAPRLGRVLVEIGERIRVGDAEISIDADAAEMHDRCGREEHVTCEPKATHERLEVPVAAE